MKQQEKYNFRIQALILAAGVLIFSVKLFAFYITGSNAILSDALESIINILAGGFGLYSLYFASLPKDEDHPHGHGKIEFLSVGIEGGLIFLAGLVIIGESINAFLKGNELHALDTGIMLSLSAGLGNFLLGTLAHRRGKKTSSSVLMASGKHLQSDGYTSAGLILGLGIVYFTHLTWLDSVIALAFAGIIIFTGYKLIRKALSGIMDEADKDVIQEIAEILERKRKVAWIDLHKLRVIRYGNSYHIDCHLTLPWYWDLKKAHDEMEALQQIIRSESGRECEFYIHMDSCEINSCSVCQISDCPHRKNAFTHAVLWTPEQLIRNKKHGA